MKNLLFALLAFGLASFNASANPTGPVTPGNLGSISLPATLTYGNTINSAGTLFNDLYTFTIMPGSLDSVTTSIDLGNVIGLNNLSSFLFSNTTSTTIENATVITAPVPGIPSATATELVLSPVDLGAGTYTLQISGSVLPTAISGSYSGVLNITSAVPEPSTYGMLLSGIGLLGFMTRRKI